MQDIRELYILGQPIQTNIGKLHFIKVKDYHRLIQYIPYLDIEKQDIVRAISKIDKDVADSIKDVPFLVLIKELREVLDVYDKYEEMFLFLFKDDVFDKIENEEDFNYYKDLIRKMNNLPHEEKNPNPEIQYFNDLKKQLEKQRSNGGLTFEAIYTSVWTALGQCPDNMTIYQMYAMFGRVGQFKNFDTTTLYNTVSDQVKIDPWYKHISLMEEEKKTTLEEFSRNATQYIK
jgi:hypothetical protein